MYYYLPREGAAPFNISWIPTPHFAETEARQLWRGSRALLRKTATVFFLLINFCDQPSFALGHYVAEER